MANITTSKKDFKYFCAQVKYYVREFGLGDYEINFDHKDFADEGEPLCNSIAGVRENSSSKAATFLLNKDWSDNESPNEANLKRCAIHEVGHLLLCDYYFCAINRFGVTPDQITTIEHAVIRRLENFILER